MRKFSYKRMIFITIKTIYQLWISSNNEIYSSFKHRHWLIYIILITHIAYTTDSVDNHMIDIFKNIAINHATINIKK